MAPKASIVIASLLSGGALIVTVFFVAYHFSRQGPASETPKSLPNPGSGNATLGSSEPQAIKPCTEGNGTSVCSRLTTLRRTSPVPTAAVPTTGKPATKAPGFLNGCGNNRYVVLTFDDGPFVAANWVDGSPATAHVLDELKAAGVKATFFISPGGQGGHYGPAECQVLKRAVAEGHEIQWHSWSHADLTDSNASVQSEVQQCRDWIQNDCVVQASAGSFTMLRPP